MIVSFFTPDKLSLPVSVEKQMLKRELKEDVQEANCASTTCLGPWKIFVIISLKLKEYMKLDDALKKIWKHR